MKNKRATVYYISARTYRYGYRDSVAGKLERFLKEFGFKTMFKCDLDLSTFLETVVRSL